MPFSAEKLNWNRLSRAIYAAESTPAFAKATARQASVGRLCAAGEYAPLFAAKRNDDLFVAAFKNYPAILNSLDRNLVNLSADLEAELLTFRHGLAIDDRETRGATERDRGDEKCARWNFTLVGSACRNFSSWFPGNRLKWTPRSGINVERRFVLERDGRRFFC